MDIVFPDARMRTGKECERRVRTGALGGRSSHRAGLNLEDQSHTQ